MTRFRSWLRRDAQHDPGARASRLEHCRNCRANFVYPVTWTESGPTDWWLLLRCGGCDSWRDVVATNDEVAVFDRILDAGMESIRAAAERLDRELMSAEAEVLAKALRMDLLGAEDFR
jgi:hypothetical protein